MTTFTAAAAILPVSDLAGAAAHYRALGFTVEPSGSQYAFARRGGATVHLAVVDRIDPATSNSAVYLSVVDADVLAREWAAAGVAGQLVDPVGTPYGMREGAHIDPWGNLLRFGSSAQRVQS
ncbi:bleomycin resistance protein [Streptomyces sp. NPDC092296]|uniref:bleomycin resistance protein n=1 Tax=Streptomyces sp. NPDC092296 TaxID=3366012 RepID=UPI003818B9AC